MREFFKKYVSSINSNWGSHFYRKSFIIILFITAIPGIVVGTGIYFIGVKEVERELQELHTTQIDTRAKHIDQQLNYLEDALSYWAFEPRFSTMLLDIDFSYDFLETRDIKRTLLTLQGSHPLVERVELFVDRDDIPILFRPSYSEIEDSERLDYYQTFLREGQYIDWTFIPPGEEQFEEYEPFSLLLTHNIPGASQPPFGSLIVNINSQALVQQMETLTPYEKGATLMLNEDGEVLFSSNDTEYDNFVSVLQDGVNASESGNLSFQFETKDETFTVSTGTMDRINHEWTYVSAAPISSITSPIVFISQVIIGSSLLLVGLAFILAWFASRRIYMPIRKLSDQLSESSTGWEDSSKDELEIIEERWQKLTNERVTLQKRLTEQIPQLRQNFLHQLMNGYLYHYSEDELRKRMTNYGWNMENRKFIVIDIQLTGLHDSPIVLDKDESLVTFTCMNIVGEVADDYFSQFTILNHYDLSLSLFINYSFEDSERVHRFSEEVMSKINELTEMKVTVTQSNTTTETKKIPHLFGEVSHGKRYREFENKNQLIDLSDTNAVKNENRVYYPFETEKEIIQSVRRGELEETEKLLKKFIDEIIQKGVHEINIQPGMIQLYGKIQHEILHTGIHPGHLFTGRNLLEELQQIKEQRHMVDWMMTEVICPFIKVLEGQMNIETKRDVEQVVAYMQKNYHHDISLESCADAIGTNSYSLSKSFKKIKGENFIDFLTQLRMDEAKELIVNTDLKISDIAEKVGYRHSYFNRIFKKQTGIPPSQFRKLHRKE
ncbi:helix-turn-helix domain-containing protein [Salipaludibacillus sp. HK11]|uniref:helix-turn-helix domain-containing protein n=1 Tax=Salipaludibacillus sp. HK11 TaxID=3394320 RepID=UPI0039FC60DB